MRAELAVKYGKVPLRTMSLVHAAAKTPLKVSATLDGKNLAARLEEKNGSMNIIFGSDMVVKAGQNLEVELFSGP
jgi:hypothetical protein